jgi:hypothetical protein
MDRSFGNRRFAQQCLPDVPRKIRVGDNRSGGKYCRKVKVKKYGQTKIFKFA